MKDHAGRRIGGLYRYKAFASMSFEEAMDG
jgi:hypothetical protein